MTLGTEKIEAIAESAKKVAILVKKISEDKKVDLNDIAHLVAFLPELNNVFESFKAFGTVLDEGKDLDVSEVIHLISEINKKVKQVEAA